MNKFFDMPDNSFNFQKESKKLRSNLDFLKNLSVQEHTLYKKWVETQTFQEKFNSSNYTKRKIWSPTDIEDAELTMMELNDLKPKIILAEEGYYLDQWINLRLFVHTMPYDQNPGRVLRFIIIDEKTNKFLGFSSIGSDVTSLTPRDKNIGWSDKEKYDMGKLNNTAIATTIAPTQPFGYNFIGGKLIASLTTSEYVRNCWKEKYDNLLVGITTTSLYGSNSMYNGIPYWKKMGISSGKMYIKPDDGIYDIWHQWLKENKKSEYENMINRKDGRTDIPVTGIKQKIVNAMFKYTNIKSSNYTHGYQRGVYFAPIYENYKEFLMGQISESELIMKNKFKSDVDGMISWWRKKAINRYVNLRKENRLNPEVTFYNKLPFLEWNEVKNTFLNNVGR